MKKALQFFDLVFRVVNAIVRNKDHFDAKEEPDVELCQVYLETNRPKNFQGFFFTCILISIISDMCLIHELYASYIN